MSSYELSTGVAEDPLEIARYTIATWGVRQADRYEAALVDCFERLARGDALTRTPLPHRPELRSCRCEHHVVFSLHEPDAPVLIVAVLHESMELLRRLQDRLGPWCRGPTSRDRGDGTGSVPAGGVPSAAASKPRDELGIAGFLGAAEWCLAIPVQPVWIRAAIEKERCGRPLPRPARMPEGAGELVGRGRRRLVPSSLHDVEQTQRGRLPPLDARAAFHQPAGRVPVREDHRVREWAAPASSSASIAATSLLVAAWCSGVSLLLGSVGCGG